MGALKLSNVSVVFRDQRSGSPVHALRGLNLTIEPGELVVAIGASGCGKTTLLNVIAGFIQPSGGTVTLTSSDGEPTEITGPDGKRGVVFQKHALLPWLSVRDNVAFGLKLKGLPKPERHAAADELLRLVGLEKFKNSRIYELSGGMQQRVGIARALASNPELLLLDEPLGALDAFTREHLQEFLLTIWQGTRKQILLITHSVEEALFMASRIIVMSPGPGRITHELQVGFNQAFLEGATARQIKASPEFVAAREQLLSLIHQPEEIRQPA
jgi:taurine transport system ATP-binding protein